MPLKIESKPGDIYMIPATEEGGVDQYRRILVLGESDLSTRIGPATKEEFEQQQATKSKPN